MNAVSRYVLSLLICWIINIDFTLSQNLCRDQSDFETYCSTTHKGVVVSNKCFFYTSSKQYAWNDSWTRCQKAGGSLAQILTEKEYTSVLSICPGYSWIALRRNRLGVQNKLAIDLLYTFWFDTITDYNKELSTGKTWVRSHRRDDITTYPDEYCFKLGYDGLFMDIDCNDNYYALCQIINNKTSYVKVPDACVLEGIFKDTTTSDVESCANLCAETPACRSFNVIAPDRCQLTAWDLADQPNSTAISGCYHYQPK